MDAYFTSDDRWHSLPGQLHTYLQMHLPAGLYLVLAKAHVATSVGEPVPPASEASLNATALVRLKAGDAVADQAYATVTGQWEIGINHQVVSLMAAQQLEDGEALALEAIGLGYTNPGISQLRLTAIPLEHVDSGAGIEFKKEVDISHGLRAMSAAGLFPQP